MFLDCSISNVYIPYQLKKKQQKSSPVVRSFGNAKRTVEKVQTLEMAYPCWLAVFRVVA